MALITPTFLKPKSLRIKPNDRVFFVGATGSGKTTLAKSLMFGLRNVVILDPKRTFTLPDDWPQGFQIISDDFDKLQDAGTDKTLIYRPTLAEMDDLCNRFFQWIFERENTVCYVDEVMRVTTPRTIGKWYATCLQLGREKNIGTWSATQRPANIPLVIISEAEHQFVFRLRNPADRERMAAWTIPEIETRIPKGNAFWYYQDKTGDARFYERAEVGSIIT